MGRFIRTLDGALESVEAKLGAGADHPCLDRPSPPSSLPAADAGAGANVHVEAPSGCGAAAALPVAEAAESSMAGVPQPSELAVALGMPSGGTSATSAGVAEPFSEADLAAYIRSLASEHAATGTPDEPSSSARGPALAEESSQSCTRAVADTACLPSEQPGQRESDEVRVSEHAHNMPTIGGEHACPRCKAGDARSRMTRSHIAGAQSARERWRLRGEGRRRFGRRVGPRDLRRLRLVERHLFRITASPLGLAIGPSGKRRSRAGMVASWPILVPHSMLPAAATTVVARTRSCALPHPLPTHANCRIGSTERDGQDFREAELATAEAAGSGSITARMPEVCWWTTGRQFRQSIRVLSENDDPVCPPFLEHTRSAFRRRLGAPALHRRLARRGRRRRDGSIARASAKLCRRRLQRLRCAGSAWSRWPRCAQSAHHRHLCAAKPSTGRRACRVRMRA